MAKLSELPKEEQYLVFDAFMAGEHIQAKSSLNGEWISTTRLRADGEYRLKPQADAIPWDSITPDYKWFARDGGGRGYLYINEPEQHPNQDVWCAAGSMVNIAIFVEYKAGSTHWRDSLIQRPTGI